MCHTSHVLSVLAASDLVLPAICPAFAPSARRANLPLPLPMPLPLPPCPCSPAILPLLPCLCQPAPAPTPAPAISSLPTHLPNPQDGNGQDLKVSAVSTLTQKRTNSVQSSVGSQGEAACLRMKVKCVDGNNKQHCTQSDFDTKATKWAYMLTTTNVCNYYKSYAASAGFVSDVYCCSSNGCNLDKALDSATVMLELPRRAEP